MKRTFLLLLLVAPLLAVAQNQINVNGATQRWSIYLGGYHPVEVFQPPVQDTVILYKNIDSTGLLTVNPTDGLPYFYRMIGGPSGWKEVLTLPRAMSLFAPASAAANYTAGSGLVRTGSSPNYTFAIDNSVMTVPRATDSINALKGMINQKVTLAQARSGISMTTTGSGAASYNSATGVINVPTPTSYTAGSGIAISGGTISNTAPNQVVTLTAGTGVSITGTYPNFTISVSPPVPSPVTRTLNSNFTPNTTRPTLCIYTVTCSVTNPLLVGTSSATAVLEYSTNGGGSWQPASQAGNSSGVGVTVTLQLTNGQTGLIAGIVPANALTRIRTTTSGTASVTYVVGQETTL